MATGCVSKRKYQALDTDLRAQREVSQNYRLRIDTLQMVNAQLRDSIVILDSMLVVERNSRPKKTTTVVKPAPKKSTLSATEEYSKKSVFISTFAKNVIWPDNYLGPKFIIGVVGDSPLFAEMKKSLEGKTMNGKIIEVRKFTSANVVPVHILFIAHSEIGNFQKIKNTLGSKPVLLVTEEGEKGYAGAHINFYLDENKVQYSLNKP
ncbi:MAG: YfiR family protein, partial [Bacteroidia bacterium]